MMMTSVRRWSMEKRCGGLTYRRTTPAETVDVVLHAVGVDAEIRHALLEHGRVVYTLSARENFLAAQENIERVGEFLVGMSARWTKNKDVGGTYVIIRIWHSVERPHSQGELIYNALLIAIPTTNTILTEDVIICVILFLDKLSQLLLRSGTKILPLAGFSAVLVLPTTFLEHMDTLGKREDHRLIGNDKVVVRVLSLDKLDLSEI